MSKLCPKRPTTPSKGIVRKEQPTTTNNDSRVRWSAQLRETVFSTGANGILNLTILGGSDNGEFAYLGEVSQEKINYYSGRLDKDDIILEIQGQKVAGYTQRDVVAWLNHCGRHGNPVNVKTAPSELITKDLRQYLNTRFQKGSVDHDLQNTIRDNLYLRTVPCTTRPPREGEVNGVDYTFLTVEEFMALERSGNLLESGVYEGNHYGTPKPPKENLLPPRHSTSNGHLNAIPVFLPGAHPSSEGKRRRNRSNVEAMAAKTVDSESATISPGGPTQVSARASTPTNSNAGLVPRRTSLSDVRSNSVGSADSQDLGPLPSNWEKAFTDKGEPYFIDHTSGTSHWLDPRLAKIQKKAIEECEDDELPFGWEKIDDPHYGTYYIDHVNRRTQYENPVIQAKLVAHYGNSNARNSPNLMNNSSSRKDTDSIGNPPPPELGSTKPNGDGNGSDTKIEIPPLPSQSDGEKNFFTRNPNELQGDFIHTTLVKSSRGFGFTIVGGDEEAEEFLQIKSVVPNGPAWQDGQLKMGDILVFVNDVCVLGYTHQDVVTLFQSFAPGETVELEVCRGYPLPFDPNDPNTEIVTTVAVSYADTRPSNSNIGSGLSSNSNMDSVDGLHSNRPAKSMPDLSGRSNHSEMSGMPQRHHSADLLTNDGEENGLMMSGMSDSTPDILDFYPQVPPKPEFLTVHIVKGAMGFGFTIADSAYGQKVKKILDRPRCQNLLEGDILVEINNRNVKGMQHADVVQVLKDCPHQLEAAITVQRGGGIPSNKTMKTVKLPRSPTEPFSPKKAQMVNHVSGVYSALNSDGPTNHSLYRSKTPTADLYSSRDKEVVILNRPKTPLVDTRVRPKTPVTATSNTRPKTPTSNFSFDSSQARLTQNNNNDSCLYSSSGTFDGGIAYDGSALQKPHSDTNHSKEIMRNSIGKAGLTLPLVKNSTDYEKRNRNNTHLSPDPSIWNSHNSSGSDPFRDVYNAAMTSPSAGNTTPGVKSPVSIVNDHESMPSEQYSRIPAERGMENLRLDSLYQEEFSRSNNVPPANVTNHSKNPEYYQRELESAFTNDPHLNHITTNRIDSDSSYGKSQGYMNRSKTPTHETSAYASNNVMYQHPGMYNNSFYGVSNVYSSSVYNPALDSPVYLSTGPQQQQQHSQQVDAYTTSRDSNLYGYRMARTNSNPLYYPPPPPAPGQGGAYHGSDGSWRKQSTSFEHEQPSPSSITRVMRERKGFANNSFISAQQRVPVVSRQQEHSELSITLHRQETGFGFRIVGGTEEGSQVSIGHIVPGGAADLDSRLCTGDEIIYVDGQLVLNTSHRHVVQLMGNAAANGHVTLGIRRKVQIQEPMYPYDVTVKRRENEGFGFVIISSVTRAGSAIGRIIENSPAERCGQLHVGDRILAVNGTNIMNLHHGEIVNLIKDSGYSVTLTIGPPQDDTSSTASNSQRGEEALDEEQYYAVELVRGTRGFGFSIRGGKEFQNMPLFVLRIADTGPAAQDGRLRIGDQIIEINGINTKNMTHAEAIEIIKQGGSSVRLLIKRGNKMPPSIDSLSSPVTPTSPKAMPLPPGSSTANPPPFTMNGPVSHNSSRLISPAMDKEPYYWDYESPRPV